MSNVISMDDRVSKLHLRATALRDRRYAIRHPFAADADLLDLASGTRYEGVTSDVSMGGCFICTSRPMAAKSKARLKLSYKGLVAECLIVVRIVKPRIGMGVEFVDADENFTAMLDRWIDKQRSTR
jgi:PilZ domain-containing protein